MGAELISGLLVGVAALAVLTAYSEAGSAATRDVPEGGEPSNAARNPDANVVALVALSAEAARRVEEEAPAAVLKATQC